MQEAATRIPGVHLVAELGLVSPLLLIMSSAVGRHLQQSATNAPAAAPATPTPWERWDSGASLNYGSRVGEHMRESHVLQTKCVTSNLLLTMLLLARRVCCRGSYWHHPFDLRVNLGL